MMAAHATITTRGLVAVRLLVGPTTIETLLIVADIRRDVILGPDTLTKLGAVIGFQNGCVRVAPNKGARALVVGGPQTGGGVELCLVSAAAEVAAPHATVKDDAPAGWNDCADPTCPIPLAEILSRVQVVFCDSLLLGTVTATMLHSIYTMDPRIRPRRIASPQRS